MKTCRARSVAAPTVRTSPNVRDVAGLSRPSRRHAAADARFASCSPRAAQRCSCSRPTPALVATIRRAADQHPLFVVETWAELMEAVESGRCGIALLDAAVLGARVAECVAALAAYADRLVTLVAADRAAAQDYVGFLSDGRIHRLLIKPLAIGAARLLIESATARRLQLREEPANDDAARRRPRRRAESRNGVGGGRRSERRRVARPSRSSAAGSGGGSRLRSNGDRVDACRHRRRPRPCRRRRTARRLPREGRARAPGRPTRRARRRQRPRSLSRDSRAGAGGPGRARRRFVGRRGLCSRAPKKRCSPTRSKTAAAALDHVRRVDPASSRLAFLDAQLARALAALAATSPPPANAATTPADGRADGARQRAEPRHGPLAPRAAAEPCRRQRERLSRSRRASSARPIRASRRCGPISPRR